MTMGNREIFRGAELVTANMPHSVVQLFNQRVSTDGAPTRHRALSWSPGRNSSARGQERGRPPLLRSGFSTLQARLAHHTELVPLSMRSGVLRPLHVFAQGKS